MAAIFQSFYPPAVPDSCSGRYADDVSPLTSSSLLGSEFFSDDTTAFGGLTNLLQDVCSYPPVSSCDFTSVGATDIPDLGSLLWDTEPTGSLSSDDFMYSSNECMTFGQSVESPLTNSSPVSPESLSFPSSLAASPLPTYSTPSPADFNISPALSPTSSFVEYSSSPSFTSASPVDSPPAPKRSRSSPAKKSTRATRKERKKEQNKTAAIRYRQKKKEEADILFQRQQELERKNKRLHRQADSMLAEISYLKKLWQDVCSAKKRQQLKQ